MFITKEIDINQESGWDDLISHSQTATFFQTRDWLKLWVKHFSGQPKIWGVYEKDHLVGIVPLEEHDGKTYILGMRGVLGEEYVSDFGDIIAKTGYEKIVWREVLAKFKTQSANIKAEEIFFHFIREDSLSWGILKELGGKAEEADVAPYIDLPRNWEEYLRTLERKDRHELRRKMRKLEEKKTFRVCPEGDPGGIDEFIRLMALSSDQKRSFLSSRMKDFFRDIINTFWPKKILSLCFLKLEEKNIAAVILFEYKEEMLLYNSGFDPAYTNLSPGLLLKAMMIKKAIEEGKKRFDFLRGGERYKYDLGGRERKLYNIILN